jgi:hypothetical protein
MASTKCPYARAQGREYDPPGFALAEQTMEYVMGRDCLADTRALGPKVV